MIKGKNINLRPMTAEDLELFYMWNTTQEHMGLYMNAELIYKDLFIEEMKKVLRTNSPFYMIIEDKEGMPIGVIDYFNSISSKVSIDFGILIAVSSNRGKGIGSEAISILINYLFNTKSIMRIQFMTRSDNESMNFLGKKLGFKLEGTLRKYSFDYGEYRDLNLFGITRDDWCKKKFK
ncbi:GNAT family N-acetyltransferase [Clostridium senegalense]|uniref:GNAT family N-acetyltransferase n=1 Tax=Clostridium senegalense TaxID=1465809 RepID=A0A6M0H0G2_9CLOT|nr:GNAT family protein [Clostridium senegalense]NEU04296.1 GNAT family N-acetyltransferase [Clostridium senegalense]